MTILFLEKVKMHHRLKFPIFYPISFNYKRSVKAHTLLKTIEFN